MKNIKNFDEFNESKVLKFFTGHENKEEREKRKNEFEKELDELGKKIEETPEDYAQSKNWNDIKSKLSQKAKSNNYKGKLRKQRGGRDTRYFIVYDEGKSGFGDIISGASAGISGR